MMIWVYGYGLKSADLVGVSNNPQPHLNRQSKLREGGGNSAGGGGGGGQSDGFYDVFRTLAQNPNALCVIWVLLQMDVF